MTARFCCGDAVLIRRTSFDHEERARVVGVSFGAPGIDVEMSDGKRLLNFTGRARLDPDHLETLEGAHQ